MMVFEIPGNRSVGMVRTIPDVVNPCVLRGKLAAHPVVQRAQIVFGEKAAGDAGLIGEEKDEIAGFIEATNRLRRARHPTDSVARAHVTVVVVDDAVAIEEGGGSLHGAHAPTSFRSTRWAVSTTSDAGMSRMQRWSFMVQTGRWQGWQGT